MTHSEALIWPYNSSLTSPATKDLISFKLPIPLATSSDPVPIATFTSKSAGGEPGLVVVVPKNGRIIYWEAIGNATSFVPGQTSSGVQGTVPGMFVGEAVQEILNAEPAGFILTLSHGRVAHLTVRDQVGRPGIGIQFLRKTNTGQGGSLLGTIRNVFGGDRRKSIAVVKAGRSSKGQRDVVIATEDGDLEFWDTHIGVANNLVRQVNIKEEVLKALVHDLPEGLSKSLHFKILDFEFGFGISDKESWDLVRHGDGAVSIFLLAALTREGGSTYYIIETVVSGAQAQVEVVHRIKCYTTSGSESSKWRPRICMPQPGQIAFVVFGTAVVLFSLAGLEESPSCQLLMERQGLPDPFQDCVKFQEDTIYQVLGYAVEDRDALNKHAACVVSVQGFGIVRFISTIPEGDVNDPEGFKITPKSKIEQAVFFGTSRQNPLDLTSTAGQDFSIAEIEEATLEISREILRSTSKYLPKLTPSLDHQMKLRAKALNDLISHVQKRYGMLSRPARWELLTAAEKLAAAQALWKVQEEIQKRQMKDKQDTLLQHVLAYVAEDRKTKPDSLKGETDRVRHWFINDPLKLQHLMIMMVHAFDEFSFDDITDPRIIADYYCEAQELWIAAHDTVFRFREDNAPLYGLGDEVIKDGILTTGYRGLPSFWTSVTDALHFAELLVLKTCDFLSEWWKPSNESRAQNPARKLIVHLAQHLPHQAELFSRLVTEDALSRIELNADAESKLGEEDPETIEGDKTLRLQAILAGISQFDTMPGAIEIAEKLGDTGALVALNLEYIKTLAKQAETLAKETGANNPGVIQIRQKIEDVQNHVETYFDKFGGQWAASHYTNLISCGELGQILAEAQENDRKQEFVTDFLQNEPAYSKISWINDVIGKRDFRHATNTLDYIAEVQEADLWSKKTELCLAKLSGLACLEESGASLDSTHGLGRLDDALTLLDIQDRLRQHIVPAIGPAIDAEAEAEITLDTFGKIIVGDKPTVSRDLLHDGLSLLMAQQVMLPEQLIDVFTLMDPREYEGREDEDPNVLNHEFFFALKVVELLDGQRSPSSLDAIRRVIWRRAMIRDDWILLNETGSKSDEQVSSEMHQSAIFHTLFDCFQDVMGTNKSIARLFSPTEILSASLFPDELRMRFEENVREMVESELKAEQEKLRHFVEKGQLQYRFEGMVSDAERMVRQQADNAGDVMAEAALEDDAAAAAEAMREAMGRVNGDAVLVPSIES